MNWRCQLGKALNYRKKLNLINSFLFFLYILNKFSANALHAPYIIVPVYRKLTRLHSVAIVNKRTT